MVNASFKLVQRAACDALRKIYGQRLAISDIRLTGRGKLDDRFEVSAIADMPRPNGGYDSAIVHIQIVALRGTPPARYRSGQPAAELYDAR